MRQGRSGRFHPLQTEPSKTRPARNRIPAANLHVDLMEHADVAIAPGVTADVPAPPMRFEIRPLNWSGDSCKL